MAHSDESEKKPGTVPKIPQVETGLFARFRAWLLGYDVFISYKRREAQGYAIALENHLKSKDLACFRDQTEIPAGAEFPHAIERALRRSRLLVVVGTPLAADPVEGQWVKKEIEIFLTRRSKVVIVNIAGAVDPNTWPALKTKNWLTETSHAMESLEPSRTVCKGIEKTFQFARVNRLARWLLTTAGCLIVVLSGAIAWTTGRANEQQRIARAQELAAQVESLRTGRPAALDVSLRTAMKAALLHQSPLIDRQLRSVLSIHPPLLADIETPCNGQIVDISADRRYLALASYQKLCLVDLEDYVSSHHEIPNQFDQIHQVAFGSDNLLAVVVEGTSSPKWRINIYEIPQMVMLKEIELKGNISRISFSPDGDWIAIGFDSGSVLLWSWRSEAMQGSVRSFTKFGIHREIKLLTFGNNGSDLLVGSRTAIEVWRKWSQPDIRRVWYQKIDHDSIPSAVLDTERNLLIAAFNDSIEFRRLSDFKLEQYIPAQDVDALAFTPQGWLFAHTSDKLFKSWYKPTHNITYKGKAIKRRQKREFVPMGTHKLIGDLTTGGQLSFDNEGRHVLAIHRQEGSLESWGSLLHIESGEETARYFHKARIWRHYPLGAGTHAVTVGADNRVRIWGDLFQRQGKTYHGNLSVDKVTVSRNGRYAAFAEVFWLIQSNYVRIWDLRQSQFSAQIPNRGVKAMKFHGENAESLKIATDNELHEWKHWSNAERVGGIVTKFPPQNIRGCDRASAFSKNADMFAVSGDSREIWLYRNGSPVRLEISDQQVYCIKAMTISPDGEKLAASVSKRPLPSTNSVLVIEISTGEVLMEIPTYTTGSMSFDEHGRLIVLARWTKPKTTNQPSWTSLGIWSVDNGSRVVEKDLGVDGKRDNVCLGVRGGMLAVQQGNQLQVYNLYAADARLELRTSLDLPARMKYCEFMDNDRRLVVASEFGLRMLILDREEMVDEALSRMNPVHVKSLPR